MAPPRRRRVRGLSLVEVTIALAVLGIITAAAWPSHQHQMQRARRLDATAALTRLQQAQEQYRIRHGGYATELAALGTRFPRSAQGWYDLQLQSQGPGRVTLSARARADGEQGRDRECPEITLAMNEGVAETGPTGRCWGQ